VELGLAVLGLLKLMPLDKSPEAVRILQALEVVKLVLHSEARPHQDSVGRLLRLVVSSSNSSLLHLASRQHLELKLHRRLEVSHQRLVDNS